MPQQRRRCSGLILGLVALGLLAGAALMAHPAQAVEAPGPYYAEPAWDRKLPAATRFVVLTNWASAAVLDKETGLVWERTPSNTSHNWAAARLQCTARETGNRKGWRLPSVHELASLVDPANTNPSLPTGHHFTTTVPSDTYWSATTYVVFSPLAWFVDVSNGVVRVGIAFDTGGGVQIINGKDTAFGVWCVRGAMNADQY